MRNIVCALTSLSLVKLITARVDLGSLNIKVSWDEVLQYGASNIVTNRRSYIQTM